MFQHWIFYATHWYYTREEASESFSTLYFEFEEKSKLEKTLELVVKGQLLAYLNSNNLLIPEQSGYREGHSCETALNLVLAKWKENVERKDTIVVVFLDLKRAFETISRPFLLRTIKRFGFSGSAYR